MIPWFSFLVEEEVPTKYLYVQSGPYYSPTLTIEFVEIGDNSLDNETDGIPLTPSAMSRNVDC